MADRNLKSITFPGLPNRYVIPQVEVDSSLTQQGKAADAKATGDALKANIAPAYDASSTYAVGEYVMYNNALYRCTTAIATAEAWTAEHWTAAQIGDDLADCSRQINHFDDNLPGTVQTVNFGADGKPSSVVHTKNGATVRTDAYTWGDGTVTETRTTADGSYITMVTDLSTLVTTISEIQEAS